MASGQAAQLSALAEKQNALEGRVRELDAEREEMQTRIKAMGQRRRKYEAELAVSTQTHNSLHRETRALHGSVQQLREANDKAEEELERVREELERESRAAVGAEQEAAALDAEVAGEKELVVKLGTLLKRMKGEESRQLEEVEGYGAQMKQARLHLRQIKERLSRRVAEQHAVAETVRHNLASLGDEPR